MSFLDLAQKRYSCRSFSTAPVSNAELFQILEAARLAPSAVNSQSCQLFAINTPQKMQKMNALRNWFGAQAVIVGCVPLHASWSRINDSQNFALFDLGIMFDHMALCASSLGLGTCIIGSFDISQMRQTLNLPDSLYPMIALAVGHPSADSKPSEQHFLRKPLKERLVPGSDLL